MRSDRSWPAQKPRPSPVSSSTRASLLWRTCLSAEQAEQWGLIYRCVEDAELRDEALKLARHLATQPTYGLALIKRSLNASLSNTFDEQLELEKDLQRLAGRSEDYREGVGAFMEKRSPSFKGR